MINKLTDFVFNGKDFVRNIYFLVMLFAVFSPELFFVSNASFFRSTVLMYGIVTLPPLPKMKRIDFGKNFWKYIFAGFAVYLLSSVLFSPSAVGDVQFTSSFAKILWFVFIVGFSETVIRIYLAARYGLLRSSLLMGLLHTGAYMSIFGLTVGWKLLLYLLISALGFFIFAYVYVASKKDHGFEAIVHGIYDVVVTGGL